MEKLKNLPEKIYLNLGLDGDYAEDFDYLHKKSITWCDEKIESTDPCYILESLYIELQNKIDSLEHKLSLLSTLK